MAGADFYRTTLLLFPLVAICGQTARADWQQDEYCHALFGQYAIHQGDGHLPNYDSGHYQLVNFFSDSGESVVVENLRKFAVNGDIIVGSTDKGYFILHASKSGSVAQYAVSETFEDAEHWQAALKAAGVSPDIQLIDPATMTFQRHRFYRYRVMKKLFGLSDDGWLGAVMLTTLVAMCVSGLLMRPGWALFGLAVLLGWVATISLIALSDSPGGFIGFIAFPFFYWLVGQTGRLLRKSHSVRFHPHR